MSARLLQRKNSMIFQPWPLRPYVRLLLIGTMVIGLMACAAKPKLESQAIITLNNNLAELTHWKLKGKIAWITPNERKSAYINWQQQNQDMQFVLSNLLGINLASLAFDGDMATLNADGKQFQDPSPAMLIYQTTGWNVPLERLSSWVKGAASVSGRASQSGSQEIVRYENGLIRQIKPTCNNCDQWRIDYTAYDNVIIDSTEYQLPSDITMYNPAFNATIKIKISEWSCP